MLSCKEANRLMSEGMDRTLSRRERFALWMHVAMCRACSRVKVQLNLLRRAVCELPVDDERR
jgi:hypothetical protein